MKRLLLLLFLASTYGSMAQCNLNISWTSNVVGGNINFTNTSTGVPSNPQFAWLYNGLSSSLENPTFPYDSTISTVCFAIYSLDTVCEDSVCGPVGSPPCSLNISWFSTINGGNITFTNSSSGMPSNPSFAWLYDGQGSSSENPTFVYNPNATEVCFAIYDIDNPSCQDSICGPLNDSTGTGGCNLSAGFTYVHNGTTVDFTDISTGLPAGAMYDWWYNGQSSSLQNPTLNASSVDEFACLTVYDSTWTCYDSICFMVYVDSTGGGGGDSTASITSQTTKASFHLYPNPAKSEIHIDLNGDEASYTVQLVDLTGRIVFVQTIADETTTIDVSALDSGGYLVYILDESNTSILDVIKLLKE